MFRVWLIPLLVIFLMDGRILLAWLVFVCAAVTDALDGLIARVFHQKTQLGAYIDPLADKLLIGTSYVTLAILGWLPGWLCVLVISRDLLILIGIGILLLFDKPLVIEPVLDSKLTTLAQLLTVCYFLAGDWLVRLRFVEPYLVFFTAAITLFSGFHYLILGFRLLANGPEAPDSDG